MPTNTPVVGVLSNSKVVKNLTAGQLFDILEDEFRGCLELAIYMLKTLGLYEDVSYRFSKWDPNDTEKYIGTTQQWDEAQGVMEKILNHLEIPYKVGVGEAAFYGPKLDIQIRNVHGKEDTLITIQVDQMLAEKFGMEYVDRDGVKKNPYIINVGREGHIDIDALVDAINSGIVQGAGLDCVDGAPPYNHPGLLACEEVIITPHAAFYSDESYKNLQRIAAEQARDFLEGKMPAFVVNKAVLEKLK